MKEAKIIRKIDEVGRVVLPRDYRKALGWHEGTELSLICEDGRIILQPFQSCCILCENTTYLTQIHKKYICKNCIHELNSLNG